MAATYNVNAAGGLSAIAQDHIMRQHHHIHVSGCTDWPHSHAHLKWGVADDTCLSLTCQRRCPQAATHDVQSCTES